MEKILEKSGKSQGILSVRKSGNPERMRTLPRCFQMNSSVSSISILFSFKNCVNHISLMWKYSKLHCIVVIRSWSLCKIVFRPFSMKTVASAMLCGIFNSRIGFLINRTCDLKKRLLEIRWKQVLVRHLFTCPCLINR